MPESGSIQIRKASLADLYGIWLLSKQWLPDCQGISYEDFQRLWRHRCAQNPFQRVDDFLGYLLTTPEGDIKGFFGVIPLRLQVRREVRRAVAGCSWVVDPAYRTHGLSLFKEFILRNKEDFLLVTTAGDVTATVCEKFGTFEKIPIVDYERRLIWWMYPKAAIQYKCKQRGGIYRLFAQEPFASAIALLIEVRAFLRRSRIIPKGRGNHVERISRFSNETDRFLETHQKQFDIVHFRNSEFLNWRHFDIPHTKGTSYAFACKNTAGEMQGYLVVRNLPPPEGFPGYFIVTDLVYDRTQPAIIGDLLCAAYAHARRCGASLLEVFGFNRRITDYCLQFHPHLKKRTHCTYWYKAPDEKTADFCRTADWWTAGIDGDSYL